MKRLFLILILATISTGFYLRQQSAKAQPPVVAEPTRQQILAATVQIKMLTPLLDVAGNPVLAERDGEWRVQNEVAHGLGTLVRDGNNVVIVTHDHWGALLLTAETVQFSDAGGQLLAEINGTFLRNLVRYRDQGTLLLQAPPELAPYYGQAVVRGNSSQVGAGGQVFLTRHQPGYATVEVVEARVTAVSTDTGVPVFELQSLDGSVIVKGDSGGGIWSDGALVGNMWRTLVHETVTVGPTTETVVQQVTDSSRGAVFAESIQDSLAPAPTDVLSGRGELQAP